MGEEVNIGRKSEAHGAGNLRGTSFTSTVGGKQLWGKGRMGGQSGESRIFQTKQALCIVAALLLVTFFVVKKNPTIHEFHTVGFSCYVIGHFTGKM